MSTTIAPLCYTISNDCPAAWPANASLTVAGEYPFTSAPSDETPSDFVVRAYYETLWMPQVRGLTELTQHVLRIERRSPTRN